MKQLLLFACMLLTTAGLTAQTVYVNGAATGANDGTSWANAYSELDSAFVNAPSGASVWIAAGTYITPAEGSFFVDRGISILGGFAGTETDASAADPATNVTILSGDVLQNDVAGIYDSLSYDDNNRILLVSDAAETSSFTVTIDGITFANGGIAADGGNFNFAGAGLFLQARADVSRCIFMNNRSTFGSALVILNPVTSGTTLDQITFMNNFAASGHNAYIQDLDDLTITNSTFTGMGKTSANRDEMLRIIRVNNINVDNCDFSNINGGNIRGAGIQFNNCDQVQVNNSTFDQIAAVRGAVYVNGNPARGDADPDNDMVVNNCTFTNVTVSDRSALGGGGNQNWVVNGSTFTNNDVALGSTGSAGFYTFGSSAEVVRNTVRFDGCDFSDNEGGTFGGAVTILEFDAASIDLEIVNTSMTNNSMQDQASGQGAGVYFQGDANGATNTVMVDNVTFDGNVSRYGNGIMFRGPYDLTATNSTFSDNGDATGSSNGVFTLYDTEGTVGATFDNCEFTGNRVNENPANIVTGGAAIYALGPASGSVPISFNNTLFQNNSGGTAASGAAIHIRSGVSLQVDSCQFIDNSAIGEGGAIAAVRGVSSRDTTDTGINITFGEVDMEINNSYFIGNSTSSQGGAISTQRVIADLTNNVFLNNRVAPAGASGGAIIFNGNAPTYNIEEGKFDTTGSVALEADMIHNTFFGNEKGDAEGSVGSHVALFQGSTTAIVEDNSLTINMLNNAFINEEALDEGSERVQIEIEVYNPDGNFAAGVVDPIGNLNVNSLGGNFFNGLVDDNITLNAADIQSMDFQVFEDLLLIFRDPFEEEENPTFFPLDLTLDEDNRLSNPLIDAGVNSALVPDTDILGRMRDAMPDIGAFEADGFVGVTDIEESGLNMSFFPNPTVNLVTIQNNDANVGKFFVSVTDQTGRLVSSNVFTGVNSRIDLTNVPSGVYNLVLLVEGKMYSKQIVKQ